VTACKVFCTFDRWLDPSLESACVCRRLLRLREIRGAITGTARRRELQIRPGDQAKNSFRHDLSPFRSMAITARLRGDEIDDDIPIGIEGPVLPAAAHPRGTGTRRLPRRNGLVAVPGPIAGGRHTAFEGTAPAPIAQGTNAMAARRLAQLSVS